MENWEHLPALVLLLVADRLPFAGDHVRLRSVNRWWRSVVPKRHYAPLLCVHRFGGLPGDDNPICFLNFTGTALTEVDAASISPITSDLPSVASHRGWIVQVHDDSSFRLCNPITRAKIDLPPFPNSPARTRDSCSKLVLSSDPSASDDLVVVFFERCGYFRWSRLAFCRPGDDAWTPIAHPNFSSAFDAAFYGGWFLFVSGCQLFVWNACESPRAVRMIAPAQPLFNEPPESAFVDSCYLFASRGQVYLVVFGRADPAAEDDEIEEEDDEEKPIEYIVYDNEEEEDEEEEGVDVRCLVEVFKLDVSSNGLRWWKVRDLGDQAVLLGSCGQSACVPVRDHPGFMPNSVYLPSGMPNSASVVICRLDSGYARVVTMKLPGDCPGWSQCMWFSPSLLVGHHGTVMMNASAARAGGGIVDGRIEGMGQNGERLNS